MSNQSFDCGAPFTMDEAFPEVDPGLAPCGNKVIVQIRMVSNKTVSGIVLSSQSSDNLKWNEQTGRVVALGPLAYRNRDTLSEWKEGAWVKKGDFVRIPRWNGDRTERKLPGMEDPVVFVTFNDHEIFSKITGNPLDQKTYIL